MYEEAKEFIKEKTKEIKDKKTLTFKMTAREFIAGFGAERRSEGNQRIINNYLERHHLETVPPYNEIWIDGDLVLRHKETAKSKPNTKPILKVGMLPAANTPPATVNSDSSLTEATTLMLLNHYSQLPVVNGKKIAGVVSWETIGQKKINGLVSDKVKDYLDRNPTMCKLDDSLLDVIQAVRLKGVVLVKGGDESLSGLLTMSDINNQLLLLSEPFLLLSQIENLMRALLNDKFLLADLAKVSADAKSIDDLSFGEYIKLIETDEAWGKLNINLFRTPCIKRLHEIREIRNDVMHFNTDGITVENKELLVKTVHFLTGIQLGNDRE